MKTITVYETSDGEMFKTLERAKDHQYDLIGLCFMRLLDASKEGSGVTRAERFNDDFIEQVIKLYDACIYGRLRG